MELHEFLGARIAEDEDYAQNIIDCEYDTYKAEWGYISSAKIDIGSTSDYIDAANYSTVAKFIERFDPARILAECAAKRAVIRAYISYEEDGKGEISDESGNFTWGTACGLGLALVALAAPYSSHHDYSPDWAV